MSGHSKWSTIKHKKAATDAKRSKIFTQMARAITVAAQNGGGDPDTNFMLRMAIDQARSVNVPKDNIERAIKRGTGELSDGARIENVVYEAMGPGGVAMIIQCATDNTNRTVSEVKTALKKNGGKFVSGGSIVFQFDHVGQLMCVVDGDAEEAELTAIEAGAEDVEIDNHTMVVTTQISDLQSVRQHITDAGYTVEDAQITYVPKQEVALSPEHRQAYTQLYDALDELDDVQRIYDNVQDE